MDWSKPSLTEYCLKFDFSEMTNPRSAQPFAEGGPSRGRGSRSLMSFSLRENDAPA